MKLEDIVWRGVNLFNSVVNKYIKGKILIMSH